MTIPTGAPAWARTTTAEDLGGYPNKRNLGGFGAVNYKTDTSAEAWLRITESVVSAARCAPLFWLAISYDESVSPSVATVTGCSTMWGGPTGSYDGASPPNDNAPTVTISGTDLIVSFPGLTSGSAITATDPFGVAYPVEWTCPNTTAGIATVTAWDATTITITTDSVIDQICLVVR